MFTFNRILAVIVGLLATVLLIVLLLRDSHAPLSTLAAAPVGGDFSLTTPESEFRLSDYRGQIVVVYFGYTYCPDICPTALAVMSQSIRQLPVDQQDSVVPLFISVDPERDTPERLQEYVQFFHPNLMGVTGTESELQQAGRQYGVAWHFAEPDAQGRYAVDHSSSLYVIDRQGGLADIVYHDQRPDTLLRSLQSVLN
ncbi:SCO family protein [Salinispirillum sp. LH 10-3-1]|uniref:SCO family protein n=1 Tax=Salinispirillum sp. LH 10-3-1 TaxID=2952525 RepID=A0AB38YBP2_9GAMM